MIVEGFSSFSLHNTAKKSSHGPICKQPYSQSRIVRVQSASRREKYPVPDFSLNWSKDLLEEAPLSVSSHRKKNEETAEAIPFWPLRFPLVFVFQRPFSL